MFEVNTYFYDLPPDTLQTEAITVLNLIKSSITQIIIIDEATSMHRRSY